MQIPDIFHAYVFHIPSIEIDTVHCPNGSQLEYCKIYWNILEYAWNMSGTCMEYEWNMHGICMEYAWNMRGISRNMHGTCMEYAWNMQGICMEHAWNMNGICVEYACDMRGIRVAYAWNTHGICMEYAWNTHGIRSKPFEKSPPECLKTSRGRRMLQNVLRMPNECLTKSV